MARVAYLLRGVDSKFGELGLDEFPTVHLPGTWVSKGKKRENRELHFHALG